MKEKFPQHDNAHDQAHKDSQIRAEYNPKRKGIVLAKRFGKVEMAKKLPKNWDGKASTAKAWGDRLSAKKEKRVGTREFFEKSWNDTPKKKKLDLLKQAYEREPRNNFN